VFSENFERLCKLSGTTPSAVVQKVGRSKSTASDWKRNHTLPKENELVQFAKILHCEVSDFFRDPEKPFFRNELEAMEWQQARQFDEGCELDDNEEELLRIYGACSKRQRVALMSLVYEFEDSELLRQPGTKGATS